MLAVGLRYVTVSLRAHGQGENHPEMLIRGTTLERIRDGQITLQFRRWKRPTVKGGGTLLTSVGQLAIDSLALVAEGDLTDSDAVRVGFTNRAELLAALSRP